MAGRGLGVGIHLLPEHVASAIAAGEVVERPVSVVKELLENALDAGARRIAITVADGGRTLVEVADDGCGIPAAELPLAVARYATSKLQTAEDLHAIRSLGFRGEALASIGAVSHLEITTRVRTEAAGASLVVDGGRESPVHASPHPAGTLVRVRDLFHNVPARQKFLKSEETERRRIVALVSRYAAAYPQVSLSLTQEGKVVLQTSGNGSGREALSEVFGPAMARQLIALPPREDAPLWVEGFISPPSVQRSNRRELTFFVNGRWVLETSLGAAVVQAYQGLLMVGRYPLAFLLVSLPPEDVDVNVHPAKAEIRFREPDRVFAIVQRTVRASLLGQAPATALRLEQAALTADPHPALGIGWDWRVAHGEAETATPVAVLQSRLHPGDLPLLRPLGQFVGSYLVAEGPDGLYLVDQHAAHERVLFETMMAGIAGQPPASQTLLTPVIVDLSPAQAQLLEGQLPVLQHLGFDVEAFGRSSFRVASVPVLLSRLDPAAAMQSVVEEFEEDETPLAAETEARVAARVCKRAAIRAGQLLSLAEQQALLADLEACRSPRSCPHGRPTMIHLSLDVLERQFGRKG
jgi:DNA mismatch repair protein MutL